MWETKLSPALQYPDRWAALMNHCDWEPMGTVVLKGSVHVLLRRFTSLEKRDAI